MTTTPPLHGAYVLGRLSALPLDALPYADHHLIVQRLCRGLPKGGSIAVYENAYRYMLTSFEQRDPEILGEPPGQRMTAERVAWHIADLEHQFAPKKRKRKLNDLRGALKHLFPDFGRSAVIAAIARCKTGKEPSDQDTRYRLPSDAVPAPWQAALRTLKRGRRLCRVCRNMTRKADTEPGQLRICEACKANQLLSPISAGNAKGDILRFLGEVSRVMPAALAEPPENLLTPAVIEVYRAAITKAGERWRDADRLKALKFALFHGIPGADLGFMDALITALRCQFPKPSTIVKSPASVAFDAIPPLERETFVAVMNRPRAYGKLNGHGRLRDSIVVSCKHTFRMFHFALQQHESRLDLQDFRVRDYAAAGKIFEAFLTARGCRKRVVSQRLGELRAVLRRMFPTHGFKALGRRIRQLRAEDPYQPVVAPGVTPEELRATGEAIFDDACKRIEDLRPLELPYRSLRPLAERARWGLVIIILSWLPLRVSNLALLIIDKYLIPAGNGYAISFPAKAMKNDKAFYQDVPSDICKLIKKYQAHVRPLIAPESTSQALWLSRFGDALTISAFQKKVPQIVFRVHGVLVSCHKFRTVVASDPNSDPENATVNLGHADKRSKRRYQDKQKIRPEEVNSLLPGVIGDLLPGF